MEKIVITIFFLNIEITIIQKITFEFENNKNFEISPSKNTQNGQIENVEIII